MSVTHQVELPISGITACQVMKQNEGWQLKYKQSPEEQVGLVLKFRGGSNWTSDAKESWMKSKIFFSDVMTTSGCLILI